MVVHTPRSDPRTTLQAHLDYFDTDHDDVMSPYDSYVGFRDLAYPMWMAAPLAIIIHLFFSYPTLPKFNPSGDKLDPLQLLLTLPARIWSYVPDPLLRIHLDRIQGDIHGSTSETYNTEGNFESTKFDEIFETYSSTPYKDAITIMDTYRMWRAQHRLLDLVGPGMDAVEWFAVWYTLWPETGMITKDELRGVFEGTIFYKLAEQRSAGGSKKKT